MATDNMDKKLVKFEYMVSEICLWTDRQTDRWTGRQKDIHAHQNSPLPYCTIHPLEVRHIQIWMRLLIFCMRSKIPVLGFLEC